jgi:hypothetical protein
VFGGSCVLSRSCGGHCIFAVYKLPPRGRLTTIERYVRDRVEARIANRVFDPLDGLHHVTFEAHGIRTGGIFWNGVGKGEAVGSITQVFSRRGRRRFAGGSVNRFRYSVHIVASAPPRPQIIHVTRCDDCALSSVLKVTDGEPPGTTFSALTISG